MAYQTIPPERERDEMPVSELERGTWIEVVDVDGDVVGDGRVLHVEVYDDNDFGRRALLTYRLPGYAPATLHCDADMTMPLLTEGQVAVRLDKERRDLIADQLEEIAELVRDTRMPLPQVHSPVTVGLTYHDAAGVESLAKTLGLTVKQATGQIYASRQVDGDSGAGVELHAVMYIKADPTGLAYTRADDGEQPQPVAGREPMHTGAMTEGGLVDETERCVASLHIPTAGVTCGVCGAEGVRYDGHGEAMVSAADTCSAECVCGETFEGFDSIAEARREMEQHIEDAAGVPCYASNGYQAPEVIAERTAACAASHPDRPCTTQTADVLPPGASCNGAPEGFEADCGMPGAHGPH